MRKHGLEDIAIRPAGPMQVNEKLILQAGFSKKNYLKLDSHALDSSGLTNGVSCFSSCAAFSSLDWFSGPSRRRIRWVAEALPLNRVARQPEMRSPLA